MSLITILIVIDIFDIKINEVIMNFRKLYPKEEGSYRNMLSRCYNPKSTGYRHYGGRGVKVCERWRESFLNFLEDMGERPEGLTLDRINPKGNYEPSNCRWADAFTQSRNKRDSILTYGGEGMTIDCWGKLLGIKPNTISTRLKRGWSIGEALGFEGRSTQYSGKLKYNVETVLQMKKDGYSQTEIANHFNVSPSTISRLLPRLKTCKTKEERKK